MKSCGNGRGSSSEVRFRSIAVFRAFCGKSLSLQGIVMLDKNFIRENLDLVRERLAARGGVYPIDALMEADTEWKNVLLRSEELRRQRNDASEAIGKLKRAGNDTSEQQAKVKEISARSRRSRKRRAGERTFEFYLHTIPNLPDASVPKDR
jgi:seryl-tRNA synthetase